VCVALCELHCKWCLLACVICESIDTHHSIQIYIYTYTYIYIHTHMRRNTCVYIHIHTYTYTQGKKLYKNMYACVICESLMQFMKLMQLGPVFVQFFSCIGLFNRSLFYRYEKRPMHMTRDI